VQLPDDPSGGCLHTSLAVHGEMFLQISSDYQSLPNPRRLTIPEIVFYYNALRPQLRAHTKPKG
jgi:hypothetical protein